MLDDATAGGSAAAPRCTWCSAVLPSDHETTCPSCGATLIGEGDAQVPGLTAIDTDAIIRNARAVQAKPRSRLMSWISGDVDDAEAAPAPPGSLSPPPAEVRREMLRLELEAQAANAQAEVEAMQADAVVEEGTPVDLPGAEGTATADDTPSEPEATASEETSDAEAASESRSDEDSDSSN
jgi:hypothetical protein